MTFSNSLKKLTHPVVLLVAFGTSTIAGAATDPEILSPADGAVVTSPFAVEVKYGDILYCDTDGCSDVDPETVSLSAHAGNKEIGLGSCLAQTECPGGEASFEAVLEPGEYELLVVADDGFFSAAISKPIKITVEPGEGPTTDEPTTEGPTTEGPTTEGPTTEGPTTEGPTTDEPTSEGPATEGPDTGTPEPDPTGTPEPDTDTTGGPDTTANPDTGGAGNKDDGCGCSATTTSGGALAWLVALALLLRRRR